MAVRVRLGAALRFCVLAYALAIPDRGMADVPNIRLTNDPASSTRPRVALDNQENVLVVWQDNRFGNDEILWQKFTPTGAPLTAPIRVTNTAPASRRPDIAVDGSGNSHVVWQEGEDVNGVGTVYWCRLDPSGVKILTDQMVSGFSGFARISVLSDGTTDIVWQHFAVIDQDVRHKRFGPLGNTLCAERQFTGTPSAISKLPALCHNAAGEAEIVLRENPGEWQLWYANIGTGCQPSSVKIYHDCEVEPAIDFAGDDLYVISSCRGNILNHLSINNACQISQGSGTSTSPSLGADVERGYATWRDTRDGNHEIYLCLFFGCDNQIGDRRLTDDPADSEDPDIAVEQSGSGHWVVVWQDLRDGNNEIYLTSAALAFNVPPNCDAGGPYSGSVGEVIQFDGTGSSDPDGTIVSYAWEFGDGETASGSRPTHAYTTSGTYTVSLTITDDDNVPSSCTTSANITGGNQPPVCSPGGPYVGSVCNPVDFDGTASNDPDGTIVQYSWDFGDGAVAEGPGLNTVTHVYRADVHGNHTMRLTVRDNDGLETSCEAPVVLLGGVGTISGVVKSLLGAQPVGGIKITVIDQNNVHLDETSTDVLGRYSLTLSTGLDYAVTCGDSTDPKWWDQVATGITLCPDETPPPGPTDVNFTLVGKAETTGIVRITHNGFAPGKTTDVSVTVRPKEAGAYDLSIDLHGSTVFSSASRFPIRLHLGAGQEGSPSFQLVEMTHQTSLDPIPISFKLSQVAGNRPNENDANRIVDTDILLAVVDSPMSDGGAPFDDRIARNLLERFQPAFLFDHDELYFPKDVDIMLDRSVMAFADDPLGQMGFVRDRGAFRGLLAAYPELESKIADRAVRPYLDLYGDGLVRADPIAYPGEYDRIKGQYPERIYGTAVNYGGQAYLSYWCFHFFENWVPCAAHEGDWEGVTIALDWTGEDWQPAAVTFGHHPVLSNFSDPCLGRPFRFQSVLWSDVETDTLNGREIPKVYIANQAHGTYPHAGLHVGACPDRHDGDGKWVLPIDAPRSKFLGQFFADLQVIPRFDSVTTTHPSRWALFEGSFGTVVPGPAELFQPRSPLFIGEGRWSNPALWILNDKGFLDCAGQISPSAPRFQKTHEDLTVTMRPGRVSLELTNLPDKEMAIEIIDVAGRIVRSFKVIPDLTGKVHVVWDGSGLSGQDVPSGVYFYRVFGEHRDFSGKMLFLR